MNLIETEQISTTENGGFMQKLPAVMRVLGAAALIIAMYSFMVRGWQNGNDGLRYLMMLGHTGLLAVIGLASGHYLKEGKGARLLMSLALVSVPVNFAILGAFVLSITTTVNMTQYPHYLAWTVESIPLLLSIIGAALVFLIPITHLGFKVLARSMSNKLSWLFLFSNMALLIPLREPNIIAFVVTALTLGVIWFSRKTSRQQMVARTSEGVIAVGLQLLPISVLLVRTLWLYNTPVYLLCLMTGVLFFTLRQISLYIEDNPRIHRWINRISTLPALLMTPLMTYAVMEMEVFPIGMALPIAAMTSAWMVYDISQRSKNSLHYRYLIVTILLTINLLNLMALNGVVASLASQITGLLLMVTGNSQRKLTLMGGGVALVLAGLFSQVLELIHHFDLGSWITMAILGMSSIVIASILETSGKHLPGRLTAWKQHLKEWEK